MALEGEKGAVCVTGGTGFVASWLIKRLLEQGFTVHTTIRPDPAKKRDISFLTNLPGASKRLKIFTADLGDPVSFEAAIEGCTGVFHLAASVFDIKEPEDVVTKRAIEGTIGILKSCLKFKTTVKRVVYTSSVASVVLNDEKDVDVMDESFWTDIDFVKSMNFPSAYVVSKTLTEKTALQFAEQHGLDLVTLVLPSVVGPFICPKFPETVRSTLSMVFGEGVKLPSRKISMVHIDDVARAHVFLLEYPNAKGRYICSSHTITLEEMAEFLSAKYPEYPIPTPESLKEIQGFKAPDVSSKKLLDSGFKFECGLDEIFGDAIQCCKEKGYL